MGARRWSVLGVLAGAVYLGALATNRAMVEVRGSSMEPTLWPGDRLLTLPARRTWVRPGRVVVVEDPAERGHLVVKRVAQAEAGRVRVLGDHPPMSTDSRHWGDLPVTAIRRVVVGRWPDVRTRLSR